MRVIPSLLYLICDINGKEERLIQWNMQKQQIYTEQKPFSPNTNVQLLIKALYINENEEALKCWVWGTQWL